MSDESAALVLKEHFYCQRLVAQVIMEEDLLHFELLKHWVTLLRTQEEKASNGCERVTRLLSQSLVQGSLDNTVDVIGLYVGCDVHWDVL